MIGNSRIPIVSMQLETMAETITNAMTLHYEEILSMVKERLDKICTPEYIIYQTDKMIVEELDKRIRLNVSNYCTTQEVDDMIINFISSRICKNYDKDQKLSVDNIDDESLNI